MIEIKKITIKDFAGFVGNVTAHFHKNTILLGGNNSGKTRILTILKEAMNNTIDKSQYKDSITIDSRVSITFMHDGVKKVAIYINTANKLKKIVHTDDFPIDTRCILIPSKYINADDQINDALKQSFELWPEYSAFKLKLEDEANRMLARINTLPLIDGEAISLSSDPKDITGPKVVLKRTHLSGSVVPINLEGDGFNKYVSVEILNDVTANSVILIDEIENHFSKSTMEHCLARMTVQVIASSHRIEITAGINSVSCISANVPYLVNDISLTMDRAIENNVIFVEGKFDFPEIGKALEISGINDKILFCANGVGNFPTLLAKYPNAHSIRDRDNGAAVSTSRNFITSVRQIESYISMDDVQRIFGLLALPAVQIDQRIEDIIAALGLTITPDEFKMKLSEDVDWVANTTLPAELLAWINTW